MPAPKVYHYDGQTGEYRGWSYADPDPLALNEWIYPANATDIAPPAVTTIEVAVWQGTKWGKIADHRGEIWWKDGVGYSIDALGDPTTQGLSSEGPPSVGPKQAVVWEHDSWVIKADHRGENWWQDYDTPVLIDQLGDPAALGLTTERPPYVEPELEPIPEWVPSSFEEALTFKQDQLDGFRWQKEVGGTLFNGIPVRTDENSAAKIDGAVALFGKDPTLTHVEFEAQPGIWVELDQAAMDALGVAVGRHIQATYSRKRQLQNEINALTTIAEVMAYDLDARW